MLFRIVPGRPLVTVQTSRPVSDRPPTPRWLKVLVIAGLLILITVIVVTLLTGVSHEPGTHGG